MWCNQSQTNHGKSVDIEKHYRILLKDLTSRYGDAPKIDRYEGQIGVEISPFISHSWVNQKYAISLFYSAIPSNPSVYIRQYFRGDEKGEFGSDRFYEEVYDKHSGKLPDDWPRAKNKVESLKNQQPINDASSEQEARGVTHNIPATNNVQGANGKEMISFRFRWYLIAIFVFFLTALGIWIKARP
jgi:hypothetical protein